ncbi:MAG TPA: sigma 54-interacting transcriptional regulator, partial [Longimicrobiales bacterium]
ESGTGKELLARHIHAHSRRAKKPFIAINCAAMPDSLLESEMFGHVKGAFTGAVADKIGLLQAAHGGTFFLDELTEMAPQTQAKLLRVIQDGVLRRVGSTGTDAVVDVRFIAATNREPIEAVEQGQLRRDLFYRLRVVPLTLPPLRERKEDIPLLAQHFLSTYWAKHGRGKTVPTLSPAVVRALQSHPWPGNVRELQNTLERTVVLLNSTGEVQPEDVLLEEDPTAIAAAPEKYSGAPLHDVDESYRAARERLLAEFERGYFKWLVGRSGGNMSKAARIAGVDRTTLYRLMERHRLHRDLVVTEGSRSDETTPPTPPRS